MSKSSEFARGQVKPYLRPENPLSEFPVVSIGDPEQATRAFADVGITLRSCCVNDAHGFGVQVRSLRFGATQLICSTWSTDVWLRVELPGRMAVAVNPGPGEPSVFTTPGTRVAASTVLAAIVPPWREIAIFRPAGTPLYSLFADWEDVSRRFRAIGGAGMRELEFEPALDLESSEGRRFRRFFNFLLEELSEGPAAIRSPAIRRQLDDLLLGALLSMPGSHHRDLDRSGCAGASAIVDRAEQFIDANVGRAIGIPEIVKECGCSRTKLFDAFKRERAWTPLQFLSRRRLDWARRRLQMPSARESVTAVALDCGYANFGRFAGDYRRLFGERPSATLARGRFAVEHDNLYGKASRTPPQ